MIGQWQVGMPRPTRGGTKRRTALGGERRPLPQVLEDAPDDAAGSRGTTENSVRPRFPFDQHDEVAFSADLELDVDRLKVIAERGWR